MRVHWPASGVDDETGAGLRRVDLPQFLDADRPALRIAPFVELVLRDQLLAEMAARALGEDRVLGMQLHAELKVLGRLSVFADSEIAGGHALDGAVVVVEHFGRSEAGEDFHADALGMRRHPAHHVAEADDVVALVVHRQGHQPVGCAPSASLGEEQDVVAGHRLIERRAELLPVRDQLADRARVHHRAGQDVRAGLGPLFEHDDRHLLALLCGELLDADRGGQAAGAGADDEHVVLHRFARAVFFEDGLGGHESVPWSLDCRDSTGPNDRIERSFYFSSMSGRPRAACVLSFPQHRTSRGAVP